MSVKQHGQRLERIVYSSVAAATEEAFSSAALEVFADVAIERLDAGAPFELAGPPESALLVIAHEDTAQSIGILRELRSGGLSSPALILVSNETPEFEADLAELGPAAAFPAQEFSAEDIDVCVQALLSMAAPGHAPAAPAADGHTVLPPVAATDEEHAPAAAADDGPAAQAAALATLDDEESSLWKTLEDLRQRRREQLDALGKSARAGQRRLDTLKKRLAKTQESLSVEKRQRWEVVLDLRESQDRVKEVEERLARARDGETRRQKEIDTLRIDLEQKTGNLVVLTRERDSAQERLEQAQKGLEKKTEQLRARIEELRAESESLREEQARAARESDDRIAGLELELEEARRETAVRAEELRTVLAARDSLERQLEDERASLGLEREESLARVATLEEDGRKLRERLEQVTQAEGGRVVQLEHDLRSAVEMLERRTEELSKASAAGETLELELQHARAQYAKEKEESQAWIGELERELEKHREEQAAIDLQRESDVEALRSRLGAVRAELEAARGEAAAQAQALAEAQGTRSGLERQVAELLARAAKEGEEAQARIARLAEERERLDARLRRSSAETGKVSDLQKELDTLLAELADKEEERIALRAGRESLEGEVEEARAAVAREKEEGAARLASLSAERSDLERQVQEAREHAQTLERQTASLRAEVVELEVAREEDAERLRELGARDAGGSRQRADEVQIERDRLKRELDALRVDAENTRRALADSDARLRKLQQEKAAVKAEPREKKGDLAIQQLRAELGSLGD